MKKQELNNYLFQKKLYFNTWNNSIEDSLFNRVNRGDNIFLKYLQNYNNDFWQEEILISINHYKEIEKEFIESINNVYTIDNKIKLSKITAKTEIKTIRKFKNEKIDFHEFSYILNETFSSNNNKYTYSSGGGIYPVKQIVYINNIENIEKGFYIYDRVNQELMNMNKNNVDLNKFLLIDNLENKYAFAVVYTYNWLHNVLKYGEPGMAFAFYELGSQNTIFKQNCWKYHIGLCEIGGFNKSSLENILDFDGYYNHVIGVTLGGKINENC